MAVVNIITRFESKLESRWAILGAKFDAQTAELARLRDEIRRNRAVIWMLVALIAAAVMKYVIVG